MTEGIWCYFRCLVQACYREARHIGPLGDQEAKCRVAEDFAVAATQCQRNRANLKGLHLWEQTQLARTTAEVLAPYVAASGLAPEELPKLFALPSWQAKYGGDPWACIAEVMLALRVAIDADDAQRAQGLCRKAKGLHHNSGALVPEAEQWQADSKQREKWPQLCP